MKHALMVEVGGFDASRQEANARLIAAAPEMLEALKDISLLICNLAALYPNNPAGEWLLKSSAMRNIKSVIRKAEEGQ